MSPLIAISRMRWTTWGVAYTSARAGLADFKVLTRAIHPAFASSDEKLLFTWTISSLGTPRTDEVCPFLCRWIMLPRWMALLQAEVLAMDL